MNLKVIVLVCWMALLVGSAVPLFGAELVYNFTMDSEPGWTTEGLWAFGRPTGAAGDPDTGHTGSNVYGYNLRGGYTDNMIASSLTTTALDCSAVEGTTLVFYRWLGVEGSFYDRATVEVSNDGLAWTTIWSNPETSLQDTEWVPCAYDISAIADGHSTVYIRWVMGPTDYSLTYGGWNLDDVQIWSGRPWQVLSWIRYAATGDEYNKTLTALGTHFTNWLNFESVTNDAKVLTSQLEGKHIFLVSEPENATSAQLLADGIELGPALQEFVGNGGTVVVCGEADSYQGFLSASGLMTAAVLGSPSGNLSVVAPQHPVAAGLSATLSAAPQTTSYLIGSGAVPIVEDVSGNTVVAARDLGYGAVVLIGYDYSTFDDGWAHLLANAVQYPRSEYRVLVYDPTGAVGKHTAIEALVRLNMPYTKAGAADFNTLLMSEPWRVVIVDAPDILPEPVEAPWSNLLTYIASGGNAVVSTNLLADQTALALSSELGVSAGEGLGEIPTVYNWETHALFSVPNSVPTLTTWGNLWGISAQPLTVTSLSADPLAGFTVEQAEGQAALVVGNGGRTIVHGFLWDERNQDVDGDGVQDCVELVMNEILFLLRGPHTNFSTSPPAGSTPLQVNFTDLSQNATSWLWDFGGGVNSTQQNPTHTFSEIGFHTVSLTSSNSWCSDRETKQKYIAVNYPDVPTSSWAFFQIITCTENDITHGYVDGAYRPSWPVTRDQMAVYIARAIAGGDSTVPAGPDTATFTDVSTTHWAFKYVEFATSNKVVGGYQDGTYLPSGIVDRGQMAVFIARALVAPSGDLAIPAPGPTPVFADVTTENEWAWCLPHVEFIAGKGITQGYGDGLYHPEIQVTRDQMAVYIQRAFGFWVPTS